MAIFWDLQPLSSSLLTKPDLLRFRCSCGHVLSKTKSVTPHFFYISDTANSSSFHGKIFRKKSMLEKFRANVLNMRPMHLHLLVRYNINLYLLEWTWFVLASQHTCSSSSPYHQRTPRSVVQMKPTSHTCWSSPRLVPQSKTLSPPVLKWVWNYRTYNFVVRDENNIDTSVLYFIL